MLEAALANTLLNRNHLPMSLIRPDGNVLYENRAAKEMLGQDGTTSRSILDVLTVTESWHTIRERVATEGTVLDEPILLQTRHGDAEVCYVTAIPMYDRQGVLDRLLCIWATRRQATSQEPMPHSEDSDDDYTRDLEQVLEHRTYQNLLAAEQNEFAREALDALPVGILIASATGDIIYRNRAMSDDFGLRPQDYLQPDVQHVLAEDLVAAHSQAMEIATRRIVCSLDPGGHAAVVSLVPLLRLNATQRVLFQFSRSDGKEGVA